MNWGQLNQPVVSDFKNAIRPKYQEAPKLKKSEFLNTAIDLTGLNRKNLIKSLNTDLSTALTNKRSGRPQKFDFEGLRPYIMHLWNEINCICAKRMKEALKDWLLAQGPYISSLTMTDVYSTWTSNRAMMGKTGAGVVAIFKDIESYELPFLIKEGNGDCGSEFLNKTVVGYAKKRWKLTRSRPYKKNDNCFVEQKNFTHVRQLFGYERLDEQHLVNLMNEIYKTYWNPMQNFFLPNLKLKEKVRIGSRIKKVHDKAKTPYQRILNAPGVTQEMKDQLKVIKSKLKPFELKQGLTIKLKEFNTKLRELKNLKDVA